MEAFPDLFYLPKTRAVAFFPGLRYNQRKQERTEHPMQVTYIKHSGFLAELDSCALLFDYFEGEMPPLPQDKPLYIFASHSHPDHFTPDIFQLALPGQPVHYILSSDIFPSRVPAEAKEQTTFLGPHQVCQLPGLKIATLESTDMGVAFLVECQGEEENPEAPPLTLYHAGDLNCWVWDGAPRFQNDAMRDQYRQEMELLKGKKIHVAFVPLDSRQEADFDLGLHYLLEMTTPDFLFPMHMWEDYTVIPLLKSTPSYRGIASKVQDITAPGQVFTINPNIIKGDSI